MVTVPALRSGAKQPKILWALTGLILDARFNHGLPPAAPFCRRYAALGGCAYATCAPTRGQRHDCADERPYGEREKRECEAVCLLSNKTD